jgi:DNA phosphorothioation-associated putative methyltransferase
MPTHSNLQLAPPEKVAPVDDWLASWSQLVLSLPQGKRVGGACYFHIELTPATFAPVLHEALSRAGSESYVAQVLKVALKRPQLSLLFYEGLGSEAFPCLRSAWLIAFDTGTRQLRSYSASENPPILHRQELLLPASHPERSTFESLTAELETRGLFRNAHLIGNRQSWMRRLAQAKLRVEGLRLIDESAASPPTPDQGALSQSQEAHEVQAQSPDLQAASSSEPPAPQTKLAPVIPISRYRTAIGRRSLSSPVGALWRHELITPGRSFFDYGCGRGDDVALLLEQGVEASGWDPHFRADAAKQEAEAVNLGFVLNVIEDVQERRRVLQDAWQLTREVLAVSVIMSPPTSGQLRPYRDGFISSTGTFQKYFSHAELGQLIESVLEREPISIAPGCYFVFRTDAAEQAFFEHRQRQRFAVQLAPRLRVPRPRRERTPSRRPSRWELHAELLDAFWERAVELGRLPEEDEFSEHAALRQHLGTPATVWRRLLSERGTEAVEAAAERAKGDLLVYFALNLFERRRSFSSLSTRVQRELRAFWSSYTKAVDEARALLFAIAEPRRIADACAVAAAEGFGLLDGEHSLSLDIRLVPLLPPLLRIYVGCAERLYGTAEDAADIVKLHIQSGKVTFLMFDDYFGRPDPHLRERVKVDLRRQRIETYVYGTEEYPSEPLKHKSRYMNAVLEGYQTQNTWEQLSDE